MLIPAISSVNGYSQKANIASVNSTRNSLGLSFGQIKPSERAFLKKYMTPEDIKSLDQDMMNLGPKLTENSKKASALRDATMRRKIKEIKARMWTEKLHGFTDLASGLFHSSPKKIAKLTKMA